MDIRAIFRMVDVDKSGNISRTVRKNQLDHSDDYDHCAHNMGIVIIKLLYILPEV